MLSFFCLLTSIKILCYKATNSVPQVFGLKSAGTSVEQVHAPIVAPASAGRVHLIVLLLIEEVPSNVHEIEDLPLTATAAAIAEHLLVLACTPRAVAVVIGSDRPSANLASALVLAGEISARPAETCDLAI